MHRLVPLAGAARGGHLHVAQWLVAQGAQVEHGRGGRTALMDAASGGHVHVLRWLIGQGADVAAVDRKQWTLLHHAAAGDALRQEHDERVECVQALLAAGVDPKAVNKFGETAQDLARAKGFTRVSALL